jgi:hypothetical protein
MWGVVNRELVPFVSASKFQRSDPPVTLALIKDVVEFLCMIKRDHLVRLRGDDDEERERTRKGR